jgi:N-acetylglutamate synthase-like GNAT family acetyltransferase
VRWAALDPFNLNWPNFVVAEVDGQIAGIGQIRPYPQCPELGSIVTLPDYQGRGIAAEIIETLLEGQTATVYLECATRMAAYYTRFGFQEIPWWQAPMPLNLKAGLGNVIGRLGGWRIAVMRWCKTK